MVVTSRKNDVANLIADDFLAAGSPENTIYMFGHTGPICVSYQHLLPRQADTADRAAQM